MSDQKLKRTRPRFTRCSHKTHLPPRKSVLETQKTRTSYIQVTLRISVLALALWNCRFAVAVGRELGWTVGRCDSDIAQSLLIGIA